jgi:hypothetical protein
MRSARIKRNKRNNLSKKIKTFLTYSFFAVVVSAFLLNFFSSNLLEYSFALAKSGGVVDFKSDEKFNVALISANSLGEVKNVTVLLFDKKNKSLHKFDLDLGVETYSKGQDVALRDLFKLIDKDSTEELKQILEQTFALNFGIVLALNPSDYSDYLRILSGEAYITELARLPEIPDVSLRDSYLMYSFSKDIDLKNKNDVKIKSLASFDNEVRDIYLDSQIGKEGLSITVVNATSINGLGKDYARKILNSGGRVVDITSSNSEEADSHLVYKEDSKTLDLLSNSLGISSKTTHEEVGMKYPEIVKSDIVVVLGIDKK